MQFHLQVFLQALFHLQSTWRKVQELGLTQLYKENDDVKLFVGMMDATAFLPVADVAAGIDILRANMPNGNGSIANLCRHFVRNIHQAHQLPIQIFF